MATAQLLVAARQEWGGIPEEDRRSLVRLLAKSKGNPWKLSKPERRELHELVKRSHVPHLMRRSLITVAASRARGR